MVGYISHTVHYRNVHTNETVDKIEAAPKIRHSLLLLITDKQRKKGTEKINTSAIRDGINNISHYFAQTHEFKFIQRKCVVRVDIDCMLQTKQTIIIAYIHSVV